MCDLGDQWLHPILIDCESEDYTNEKLGGFSLPHKFKSCRQPAELRSFTIGRTERCRLKSTIQTLLTCPFLKAAEYSQAALKPAPLLECRIPFQHEIAHWEFSGWDIYLSTSKGLYREAKPDTIEGWTEKSTISQDTIKMFSRKHWRFIKPARDLKP